MIVVGLVGVSWFVDFRVTLAALNILALLAAIVGLRIPSLGLLAIGLLCVLDPLAGPLLLQGGLWRWNTLNYWLLIVIVLGLPYLVYCSEPISRLGQGFIALLGLELLLSPDLPGGVQHLFTIVIVFGFLIYVARCGDDPDTWFWLGIVAGLAGFGVSVVYLAQRWHLPHVNPNVWSYAPLTGVLLATVAFAQATGQSRRQALLCLLAIANTAWVFLSGSRGSLSVALIALAFVVLMAELRRTLLYFALGALLAFGIFAQFGDLELTALKRIQLLTDPVQSTRVRTSGRFDLFLGGWYMFTEHPMGVGTGGFATNWANLGYREGLSGFKRGQEFPAHSAWIKVLVENGLPGALLLVAYVLSFVWTGARTGTRRGLLLGALATSVLGVAWISTEFYSKGLWFLAAVVTGLTSIEMNRRWSARGATEIAPLLRTRY